MTHQIRQKALFVSKPESIKYWNKDYRRVYFGNEFCQYLMPSREDLEKIIDFTSHNAVAISLVTPAVNDDGLRSIDSLAKRLAEYAPRSELVVNDWGVLELCRKYNLTGVLGRLLTKQKRDPRLKSLFTRLSDEANRRFRESAVNPAFEDFLKSSGIARVELDYLLQGVDDSFEESEEMHFSLYMPYGYITTTRYCIFSRSPGNGNVCDKACQAHSFSLHHRSFEDPVILKGNTLFFKNTSETAGIPAKKGLDRIVFQPAIPL
jgi:hypothetical protein